MRQVKLVCAFVLEDVLLTTFVDVCSVSMLSENRSSPIEMARSLLVLLLLGLSTISTDDSDDVQDEQVSIREDDHAVGGDMQGFFVGEA
jgi:hypothetical protein